MDLRNIITKNNELFGFMIQDGDEQYPVIAQSLHTPIMLDPLLDDGWELFGLPYDLRKGDIKSLELPTLTYTEVGLDDEKEQFLRDTCVDIYKDVDLKSKLSKEVIYAHLKFRESSNKIKTREEFIKYLESLKHGFDLDSELVYMPLNSFVAKEALFTVEEYFNSDNSTYRSLILKRRTLSVRNFLRLLRAFKANGLSDTFVPKELVDMYFSWGICGINFQPYDKQVKDSNLRLGASATYNQAEADTPYLRENILTYLKTNRSFHIPQALKGTKFKPYDDEANIETKAREIIMLGEEYIEPILLETVIFEQVTSLHSEELSVKYNDNRIVYKTNSSETQEVSIEVVAPFGEGKTIRQDHWNLLSPEVQKDFFEESFLKALEVDMIERSTEHVKVSTLQALRSVGVGIRPALKFMLQSDSLIETAFETIYGEDAVAANDHEKMIRIDNEIHNFLDGEIPEGTRLYDAVAELLENIISGTTNIDMIDAGVNSDRATSSSCGYYRYLKVARKYLEVSLEELAQGVSTVTKDSQFIEFGSEVGRIRIPINARRNKRKGYEADRSKYSIKAVTTANNFYYVTEVYTELGPKNNPRPRHVAMKVLEFYTGDRSAVKCMDWIKSVLVEQIQNNIPYKDQSKVITMMPVALPTLVFEAGMTGRITIPKLISANTVISVPADIQQAIFKNIEEKFDSVYAFSELAIINPKDGWFSFIANAVLIGDVVVPFADKKIIEKPLPPIWTDNKNLPPAVVAQWIGQNYIAQGFRGYEPFYKRTSIINFDISGGGIGTSRPALSEPLSVPSYWKWAQEYKDSFPKNKELVAPRSSYYASLYEGLSSFDELDFMQVDDSEYIDISPVDNHRYGLDPVREIDRETIFSRFPNIRQYFEIRETAAPVKYGIHKMSGYTSEDYLALGSFTAMKFDRSFPLSKKRPIEIHGDYMYFANNERLNYAEVTRLDTDVYAVEQLQGNKYIIEDIRGQLWEVLV